MKVSITAVTDLRKITKVYQEIKKLRNLATLSQKLT